jgi:ankyrin repeat protein
VALLLSGWADATIADEDGVTPLMAAAERGFVRTVRVLLRHPSVGLILGENCAEPRLRLAVPGGAHDCPPADGGGR